MDKKSVVSLLKENDGEATLYSNLEWRCGGLIIATASDFQYACSVISLNVESLINRFLGENRFTTTKDKVVIDGEVTGCRIYVRDSVNDEVSATLDLTEHSVLILEAIDSNKGAALAA